MHGVGATNPVPKKRRSSPSKTTSPRATKCSKASTRRRRRRRRRRDPRRDARTRPDRARRARPHPRRSPPAGRRVVPTTISGRTGRVPRRQLGKAPWKRCSFPTATISSSRRCSPRDRGIRTVNTGVHRPRSSRGRWIGCRRWCRCESRDHLDMHRRVPLGRLEIRTDIAREGKRLQVVVATLHDSDGCRGGARARRCGTGSVPDRTRPRTRAGRRS